MIVTVGRLLCLCVGLGGLELICSIQSDLCHTVNTDHRNGQCAVAAGIRNRGKSGKLVVVTAEGVFLGHLLGSQQVHAKFDVQGLTIRGDLTVVCIVQVVHIVIIGIPVDNDGLLGAGLTCFQLALEQEVGQGVRITGSLGSGQNRCAGSAVSDLVDHGDLQNLGQLMTVQVILIAEVQSHLILQSQSTHVGNLQGLIDDHAGLPQGSIIKQLGSRIHLFAASQQLHVQIACSDGVHAGNDFIGEPSKGSTHQHAHTQQQRKDAGKERIAGRIFAFHTFPPIGSFL